MPARAIYCGRPTLYGNPWSAAQAAADHPHLLILFVMNFTGNQAGAARLLAATRFAASLPGGQIVIGDPPEIEPKAHPWITDAFKDDAPSRLTINTIRGDLGGRDLACWCPLDSACHVDVLLRLANR